MWGYDKRLATLQVVILMILDEDRRGLSWCAVMGDEKFDVCICDAWRGSIYHFF